MFTELEIIAAPSQFVDWLRGPVYKMQSTEFPAQRGGTYRLYNSDGFKRSWAHPRRIDVVVPLDLEFCCKYSHLPESVSAEDRWAALRIRVRDKGGDTAIRMNWLIPEIDHVARLLRVIADEWEEVREQIAGNSELLVAIRDKASPEELGEWRKLDWLVLPIAEKSEQPATVSAGASDDESVNTAETTNARAPIPPDTVGTDIADDQEKRYLNAVFMRKHLSTYLPETAEEIIAAFPKAWKDYERAGGRWGPGLIAAHCLSKATTVGRYLKAFVLAGYTHVNGIEIPYTPRGNRKLIKNPVNNPVK